MRKRRCISLFLAVLMAFSMVLSALPSQQLLVAASELSDADNITSLGDAETNSETDADASADAGTEASTEASADSVSSGLDLVDSVSHVTVHDPSIVKGYVAESVTRMSKTVEIVGEKDDTHTKAVYFIFGSHLAWAYSWDMVDWSYFSNNINRDYSTLFANEFDWANNGDSAYAESGNMWAPDVIWNEAMGKWCMYMSINGCSWNSCICMLTADSLYGDWTYVGPVVYSGFTSSGTYSYTQTDYALVTGDTSLPSRYTTGSYTCYDGNSACTATTWNTSYGAHAIDPCVTYDADGNLWMSYGSWSGGIYIFKLDAETGLRDYTVTYTNTSTSDSYMGYKISGGYTSSGEASYIEYINGYYYLFVTYGGLTAAGGYNMRVFRSETINGNYVDESGDSAIDTTYVYNYNNSQGMRVMSYYKWSFQDTAQVAQGHNSVYYDEESGKIYLVYHRRTDDGTEGHEVRVHQLFVNEDGWLVTAPFEYTGETISETGYSTSAITGTYEMLIQYQDIDFANLGYSGSKFITLESDGTVSGSMSGTWTTTDDSPYVTMVLNGETYKGVFLEQQVEGEKTAALTFTVVGTTNETALWGYQCEDTTTATVGSLDSSGTPETLSWSYLNNFFLLSAAEGDFTMEWTFMNYNQGSSASNWTNYILYITPYLGLDKLFAYTTDTSAAGWNLRSDAYSNDTISGTTVTFEYDWDWDDYVSLMNGAEVQATLTRSGTTLTYTAVITGADGNTYNYKATAVNAPTDALAVYVGGENCYLEIEAGSITVEDSQTAPTTHTWDAGTVTKAATCTTAGTMTYTCTDEGCTETKTVMIPATGHSYVAKETVAPTCTEKGYTVYECSVCGNTVKKDYEEELGHIWVVTETVEATSQTTGHTTYTCSVCGETYTTEIAIPISICTVEVEDSYTYTGSAIKPVTVKDGDKTLTVGTDYTISYTSNTSAGTAKFTITGIGDYTGTYSGTFTIAKATCTATLSATSYTYDGTAKKPSVTVKNASGKTVSSSYYTVAYSNNTNAGTATVTITMTGSNYTGTITENFTIAKATQTVSVSSTGLSSIKAGKTTTWTAKTTGDGKITYSTTASSSVGTVNSSTGKVTAKGVGTIKVYAQAAATTNYAKSSKKLIATITVGLTTPTISSVKQSGTTVTVKWAQITGAKGYYVYRSTSKNGTYTQIAKITSGSTLSYKDTASKTNGTTYYYKVKAYSGSTKSSYSSVKSLKYMKATVSSLTNTTSGITVKWSKVSGATGYYVYRKASTDSSYKLIKTYTSGSTVSYTDTAVKSKNGTTYTYYVQPYNSTSKGAYATKKTVRLTSVSVSSLKNSSSKKMTLKWAKNSKATGYEIQYSTSSSFSSSSTKKLTISSAATVSRTIGSLTKGKTYYVRIRSYKKVSSTKYYSAWTTKSVKISK